MTVIDARLSLLEHPELWSALESAPGHPPRVDTLTPRPGSAATAQPCLVIPPPGAVRAILPPELAQGTELYVAYGADRSEWSTPGRAPVSLSLELDGRSVFTRVVQPRTGLTPGAPELGWRSFHVPLDGVREVVFRTRITGAGDPPTRVGFARCEIQVRRTLARARASSRRPSLLFICVDTLRADRLSCYGAEQLTSPAIDALAARGTRYAKAFAPSPWTWPSTASLLTGLSPPEHGVQDAQTGYLSPELTTLAEVLQAGGATTAAISTNPLVSANRGFGQGFEEFRMRPWRDAHEVAPEALAWLEQNAGRRFFLYLHLTDPHLPYEPEPDLAARFAGVGPIEYDREAERSLALQVEKLLRATNTERERLVPILERRLGLYDAEVAGVDRQVGRILAKLAELGRDDVLVVVTSDHGEEFLEHGLLGHGKQLWDESVRVPLILAGPGVAAGRVVEHAVEARSVGATLLPLLDSAPPATMRGPGLAFETGTTANPLFLSVHDGRWVDREAGRILKVPFLYAVQIDGRRLFWAPGQEGSEHALLVNAATDSPTNGSRQQLQQRIEHWLVTSLPADRQPIGGGEETIELLREIGYVE